MPEVSLFRLYTLRLCYLIMALGLACVFWPTILHHTPDQAIARGIQFALFGGLCLTAALGLRYPVKMIPVLIFELTWKAVYLLFFALPLWRAHQITPAAASDIQAVLVVVIFIPLIPWSYVVRQYILAPGERWTRA